MRIARAYYKNGEITMGKNRKIIISVILVLIILISTGCSKTELKDLDKSKTIILTVDESSVFLNELMYHIMLSKLQGELYASFLNETDFWDKEYKDGMTMGEVMKQESMDNAIKYELLYQMARDEKYTLTEEEVKDCENKVESILASVPEDELFVMELSKEQLLEIQKKISLSTRYYNDYYKSQGINDDTAYEQMKKGHKIGINEKVWKQVELKK